MERALFVGNGLNQLSDHGASWKALLTKLAGHPKSDHEQEVRDSKPFTLWYEELQAKSRRSNLKEFVAKTLRDELMVHQCHRELMAIDWQVVLTTNYDYVLQDASRFNWKSENAAPERLYSLFRRHVSEERQLWHIHGELDNVSSIMLGHGQYAGYLHKVRNYLTSGVETKVSGRKNKPYLSKFSPRSVSYKGNVDSWVDHFLGAEVHMIGYSLDFTENHIWNLVIEKQRLRKKHPSGIGRLIYHRCSHNLQSTLDEARLSLLEAFGVKVVDHVAKTYEGAYLKCIESLR